MKRILIILLMLISPVVHAEQLPPSFRNVNSDFSGIISDELPDILMNPAEITKLDQWKYYLGIGNLLNREEFREQLNSNSKPRSLTVSSPILGMFGNQSSKEFKNSWIGTIYNQHNSQAYGLNPNDDINPNSPGVDQPGISWKTGNISSVENGFRTVKATSTEHYLNNQSMNLGVIYGWKKSDKTNIGISINYRGSSSQEPNSQTFEIEQTTTSAREYVYDGLDIVSNENTKDSSRFYLNIGMTSILSHKAELGLSGGIFYIHENNRSDGYDGIRNRYFDWGSNTPTVYEEIHNTILDDDNDSAPGTNNSSNEDGIDGSPGNLPGIDDDGDGRIDEDPSNINYRSSGIGIPVFLNYKLSVSKKLKIKAFLDAQVSLSTLNSNATGFISIEDTYSNSLDTTTDCFDYISSTWTDTTGTKLNETINVGFGYEAQIAKGITFYNGVKLSLTAYQSTANWQKTEQYSIKTSTYAAGLSGAAASVNTNSLNSGAITINSTEYVLQVPFGIEFRPAKKFGIQLGLTWQARHLLVKGTSSQNSSRSYDIIYYMGMSFRLSDKVNLDLYNSFNELSYRSFVRWNALLKGYF